MLFETQTAAVIAFDSSQCLVSNGDINGGAAQIVFSTVISSAISACTFTSGYFSRIYLTESEDCLIQDCIFINTDLQVEGTDLSDWTHTVSNVTRNGKPIGYFRKHESTFCAAGLQQLSFRFYDINFSRKNK